MLGIRRRPGLPAYGCTISLQVNHPPGCPRLWGPANKRLLSSHGLTHLETSIWAVGGPGSRRPRGSTSLGSPHPRGLCHHRHPEPPACPEHGRPVTRGRAGPAGLGGADRRPPFGPRAPGTGPSPAFYMTAGPVPCACLVASRHGGFSGGRRLRAQPGWRSQRSCCPGRPGEVPAPWGPHGGAFARVVPTERGSEAKRGSGADGDAGSGWEDA